MKKALIIILAVISVIIFYLIKKYYYPPKIIIAKSDVAKYVLIETDQGNIKIKLKETLTLASAQFTKFVRSGFYDKTLIYHIVPDLLIEMGDPLTRYQDAKNYWGAGGAGATFKIKKYKGDKMLEGKVVMTDTGTKSYGSHFAIITKNTPWMTGRAEIIGEVVEGMDIVHKIEKSDINTSGIPNTDIKIVKITEL